jgi:NADH-quinone oxidoreductase subunit J
LNFLCGFCKHGLYDVTVSAYKGIVKRFRVMVQLLFYIFASLMVLSAIVVVTARNPVHSVLWLIVAFLNASGVFMLAGAEFLALILAIVYVGAVAVLFLFVVMMLDVDFEQLRGNFKKNLPAGVALGVLLMVELIMLSLSWRVVPAVTTAASSDTGVTNTEALGRVLYTDYIVAFQGAGLVLLVAMIGAIVLTLRKRDGVRKQNIGVQVGRKISETLEIRTVKSGEGIS